MDSALTAVGSSGLPLHLQSISCQKGSVSKICSTTCLWSTYGCAVVCPSTSRKEEQSYNLQSVCRTAWEHVCIGWKPLSIGSIGKYSTNGYNHSSINWLTKNVLQVRVQCGFTQVLDHSEIQQCIGYRDKMSWFHDKNPKVLFPWDFRLLQKIYSVGNEGIWYFHDYLLVSKRLPWDTY